MVYYYAVANGRKNGIYTSEQACLLQVACFKDAKYEKFKTKRDANAFMAEFSNKSQYAPQEAAVPLGLKNNIKSTENKKEVQDFWPPSDGDSFHENQITDEDLLMALAEVEGLPESSSSDRKRKVKAAPSSRSSKFPRHESKIWEPAGIKHIGPFEFLIDEEGFVIVYTDGSCFNNGRQNACAGYGVYFGDNHPFNAGKPVMGRVTKNVCEIQAAIHAIRVAKRVGITKLCLSTDSEFLINAITVWIKGWKAKNWRLKNGNPVKNVVEFKELDELLQDGTIIIKWNYVKGHLKIKGNKMANKLAREGSEKHEMLNQE